MALKNLSLEQSTGSVLALPTELATNADTLSMEQNTAHRLVTPVSSEAPSHGSTSSGI